MSNKKTVEEYREDFNRELKLLISEIALLIPLAESEHIDHFDIQRSINLIDWTTKTLSSNYHDCLDKIKYKEHKHD